MTAPRILPPDPDELVPTPVAERRVPETREAMTPEDQRTAQALLALLFVLDEIEASIDAPDSSEEAA